MKKIIIGVLAVVLLGIGAFFVFQGSSERVDLTGSEDAPIEGASQTEATSTAEQSGELVIGKSAEGRDITARVFGNGDKEILFVGGIHGGYEWNTALVAYELINYLEENSSTVPGNLKVTVIPVLNPDGLYKVTGKTGVFSKSDVDTSEAVQVSGRFNGNNVDLNRNFDCDWKAEAKWQDKTVSGGSAAFSEPEAKAFRDYVQSRSPAAVLVWYSAAGGVFASNCHDGVLPETETLTDLYAQASGYPAYREFNFYEITGDAVNWLAKEGIPAISILLTDHENTEWDKNKAGVEAVLKHYGN